MFAFWESLSYWTEVVEGKFRSYLVRSSWGSSLRAHVLLLSNRPTLMDYGNSMREHGQWSTPLL